MSLLAPLYLLGAVAIAIPIILHRRRQKPDTTAPFSTLLFLEPTPPKVKTKTKIENLLLLLLRCLALILIALCFGRPLIPSLSDEPKALQRHVILLDTSASMQREDLQTQMIQEVETFLKNQKENTQVALLSFDRETIVQAEFTSETKDLNLELISPSWHGSHLGNALHSAAEYIQQAPMDTELTIEPGGTIHLFTDLQQGADLSLLTEQPWPEDIEVVLHTVSPQKFPGQNASIHTAPPNPDKPEEPRVRISNLSTSSNSTFTLHWKTDQENVEKSILQVEPGKTRILPVPPKPNAEATTLQLAGDPHDFDNQVYVAPAPARPIHILHLLPEADDTPQGTHYYLKKALLPTKFLLPTVLSQTPETVPSNPDFTTSHLLILETPISEELIPAVKDYYKAGRSALILLKDAEHLPDLAKFLGLQNPGNYPDVKETDYHLFEDLDTTHPVLTPFHDPRFRDFSKLHVWQHRPWFTDDGTGDVLASFDDQRPALIHVPHDNGNSLILTTTWAPKDSQLALSTKFIPLLYSILEFSIGNLQPETNYTTDLPIDLNQFPGITSIETPSGEKHSIQEEQKSFQPTEPGIYKLLTEQHTHILAINLPPKESETQPLEDSTLLSLTNSTEKEETPETLTSSTLVHIEGTQKLWRWLLVAALVILAIETWLASMLTRATQ